LVFAQRIDRILSTRLNIQFPHFISNEKSAKYDVRRFLRCVGEQALIFGPRYYRPSLEDLREMARGFRKRRKELPIFLPLIVHEPLFSLISRREPTAESDADQRPDGCPDIEEELHVI
jgi:hypothetical protein